ncbi:GntR family transcriptional regulator [Solicola sp. PLA-1-18]|uniref:GntR family transcriptional regulator n=1 Tax=Solicola sp. PLA-1-18 TaxID=3380532 RepID=UPI003B7984D7
MAPDQETSARRAFEQIRAMVVRGEVAPGAKMVVRPLAERLGLSPTPIKSALAALERDGFLVAVTNRGYFVPSIDDADMREIFELREALEGLAARTIAARDDRAEVCRELWRLHHLQVAAADEARIDDYSEVNLAFHRLVWTASGNRRLTRAAENLVGQTRLATPETAQVPGRMAAAMREHAALVSAVERGDAAAAEALARDHVRASGEAFTARAPRDEGVQMTDGS